MNHQQKQDIRRQTAATDRSAESGTERLEQVGWARCSACGVPQLGIVGVRIDMIDVNCGHDPKEFEEEEQELK